MAAPETPFPNQPDPKWFEPFNPQRLFPSPEQPEVKEPKEEPKTKPQS